jgi:hypothetical protein
MLAQLGITLDHLSYTCFGGFERAAAATGMSKTAALDEVRRAEL